MAVSDIPGFIRKMKDWMAGRTVLISFMHKVENQAGRDGGSERRRMVLKGGVSP